MRKGGKTDFLKNQVAYYLSAAGNSGANGEWKYADDFATLIANPKTFYLEAGVGLGNSVFRSGFFHESHPKEPEGMIVPGKFVYDPLDTTRGENVEGVEPSQNTAGNHQKNPLTIRHADLFFI